MKEWSVKDLRRIKVSVAIGVLLLVLLGRILTYGIPLTHMPNPEKVDRVTIEKCALNQTREFSDKESVEICIGLVNFLNYNPFLKDPDLGTPVYTVTFYLKDGRVLEFSANGSEVFYNGKGYRLKEKWAFVGMTEVIFLQENG